jgi:hypothetical protein
VRILLLVALAAGCATTSAAVDPAQELAYYQATVEGLQGRGNPLQPSRVDYRRLRQAAYFERQGKDLSPLAATLTRARVADEPARAVAAAEGLLTADFTDIEAHLERARVLHRGDAPAATLHEEIAAGLLQSILDTGELGQRPFRIFDRRESRALLAYLDLRPLRYHDPWWDGRRKIERVDCVDRRRRPLRVFFDVTPPRVKPAS